MYSPEEEVAHSITHFLAGLISAIITLLIIFNTGFSFSQILPLYIMGFTATWAFFASCVYHLTKTQPLKERNRLIDKSAIYVMIAGSGSSITLMSTIPATSIVFCLILLVISSLLIINLCLNDKTSETFIVVSYVLLGWLASVPASGLLLPSKFTDFPQLWFLLGGGVIYSLGLAFYIKTQKWFHTIWHILSIIGFGLHFIGGCLCLNIL
jgi:hemolysin III